MEINYLLFSYNNEGIIPIDTFISILEEYGEVEIKDTDYNTYRGCRNLNGRLINKSQRTTYYS